MLTGLGGKERSRARRSARFAFYVTERRHRHDEHHDIPIAYDFLSRLDPVSGPLVPVQKRAVEDETKTRKRSAAGSRKALERLKRTTAWRGVNENAEKLRSLKRDMEMQREKEYQSNERDWERTQKQELNDKSRSIWSMYDPSPRFKKEDERRQAAFNAAVSASPTPARPPPKVVSAEERQAISARDKEKSQLKAERTRALRIARGYDFYCPICQEVTPHMENPRECSRCGHGKPKRR
jgi:rubrerythrin